MIKYGETGKEKYYYNPALPDVQSHLITVVEEVVKNYDIDAIHFDDYFYPYEVHETLNTFLLYYFCCFLFISTYTIIIFINYNSSANYIADYLSTSFLEQ